MTTTAAALPRWDLSGVHESVDARSFRDDLERLRADVDRLVARFDDLGVGAMPARPAASADGEAADRVLDEYNRVAADLDVLRTYAMATVATDSRDAPAQSALSEIVAIGAPLRPLLARLAEWVAALDPDELAGVSAAAHDHVGPLRRLAARAQHQMPAAEEHLYAELATTGSAAWARLQGDVTSQLTAVVELPEGARGMPMAAVRGLAEHADPAVRRASYDAELAAWHGIEVPVAAALNAIKGEAGAVNRRRGWERALDASLFANSVAPETFAALQAAIGTALHDLRGWMRTKAALHGHPDGRGLPWWDLVAPSPVTGTTIAWDDCVDTVRAAFGRFGGGLAGLVDRALGERWIDAAPRDGKRGGAFCTPFVDDRSLVLLNWNGSADSLQTTAHELGHAYHNVMLAGRTHLQKRLPMALAETASIFCETLVVEAGLERTTGDDRLALLDVDLAGANQIIVDIHSRFVFETELFVRRRRRTLAPAELCEMMRVAQLTAYGDALDQSTAHPYMWLLKPHYYSSHFYNWPYTYGLLFGLGLYARYRDDPDRFRAGYETMLSRAGMDTAEELGAAFGLDVTDEAFWQASLDVVRARIAEHRRLAAEHLR